MFGILGNNARNLLYIKKFNDKKAIRLANNKLETKNFLSERGIPFAKTYGIISNRNELYDFDFSYLPKKTFVIKPNQGSKGEGILIVKNITKEEQPIHKKKNTIIDNLEKRRAKIIPYKTIPINRKELYHVGEKSINDETFRRYLLDIIDGKYSMTMGNDKVIIEEKLIPGELFKEFCERGLADIRIIVFNLVPIATMIRVPTKYSNGKANLAQGGLGLGIEVGTGKITSMLRKNKVYTRKFPKEFGHFFGKQIPYRNDILFLSSKAQYYVNLGYLALDRVITNEGPKLLEINARAGLEVQKVTNTPLEKILEKIEDLNIQDPEKGVEIAKTLFSKESNDLIKQQKILYLSQYGKVILKNDDDETIDVIVEIDLNKQNNYVTPSIYDKIKQKSDFILDMYENDIILKKPKLIAKEQISENKIILGRKTAEKFLIKPIHKTFEKIEIISSDKLLPLETKELHIIDERLEKLSKRLNLSAKLRPTNYFNELDNFITRKGNYNPIFQYKRPTEEKILETKNDLEKLQEKTNKLESPIKKLFLEKADELTNKLFLLQSYTKQNFKNIAIYNEKLFGSFDQELLKNSKEKVFSQKENNQEILGEPLKLSEIEQLIERYLAEKKIYGVDIVFSYDNLSRISVIMGKEIRISISKHGIFREKEILSILAHEIDTHLVRHLNGLKSGRKIFKSGTGYYLKDEEGLAIWNASKFLPEEYEKDSIYKKYILINDGEKMDFKKLCETARFYYPERSNEGLFKTAIRIKRGLIDSSRIGKGTNAIQNKIYLEGYEKIKEIFKNGGEIDRLYKGKIKIEDLDFIK
ncbi:hypothetical protein P148_SR1C00001G0552 [candidate division SR1 bacterium RAAC1_SR1_1]|nr:hypothetical protein P148_SR1C00001G0552 [candidate division SR1 bacterium RAAC1_SR1_1]